MIDGAGWQLVAVALAAGIVGAVVGYLIRALRRAVEHHRRIRITVSLDTGDDVPDSPNNQG